MPQYQPEAHSDAAIQSPRGRARPILGMRSTVLAESRRPAVAVASEPRAFAALTRTLLASVLLVSTHVAHAAGSALDELAVGTGQAEWVQGYDAGRRSDAVADRTPLLSEATLVATQAAAARYRAIAADGGWPRVPGGPGLRVGARGNAVTELRRRLAASGDLDPVAGFAPVFDDLVAESVRRFQVRHGLVPTGVVTSGTLKALNVPVEWRLRQLELNAVRLRAVTGMAERRFVVANLPAAAVETIEDGVVVTRHVAGVGKADRQSPVMRTQVVDINFNPYWTVPASIVRKDLIPRMQADPNYLTASHIRIFGPAGEEVAPSALDWNSLEALKFRFRQDPGDFNALGTVRINIANPYGVFMHDTPDKGDFGDDDRFVSSGCIHVQGVRDYVRWLLAETPGWTRERIDDAIHSGRRLDVRLAQPVPVHWVYVTAWSSPDGTIQFRNDIYGRDHSPSVSNVGGAAKPNS